MHYTATAGIAPVLKLRSFRLPLSSSESASRQAKCDQHTYRIVTVEMNLDADKAFSDLYPDESIFRAHLWALQGCISDRKNYHSWARQLRFVAPVQGNETASTSVTASDDPEEKAETIDDGSTTSESSSGDCQCKAWPSFRGHVGEKALQITPAAGISDCTHYVAVSWCWKTTGSSFEHYMVGNVNRKSKTPSVIMSRAIAFAANKNQSFIWIDKECIDQDNRDDKEAGIQSMDLVYQRSRWPVGLLNSFFDKQYHLDIWDCLMGREGIATERMGHLLEVLQILAGDKWFTRAWILQETVAGGMGMTLLARHKDGLDKPYSLGTIEGEIELTIGELQNCLAWAEECVDDAGADLDEGIADEIKQLTLKIWDFNPTMSHDPDIGPAETASESGAKIDHVYDNPAFRHTCNAAQALTYLRSRQNSRNPDRIAILANLCDYSIRLDTNHIVQRNTNGLGCGFSICAFALAVFNGDLSLTLSRMLEQSAAPDHIGYCWGPRNDAILQQLPFYAEGEIIVRLETPKILRNGGLCVSGWLWEISADDEVKSPTTQALKPTTQQLAVPTIVWSLVKDVAGQGLSDLADVLWDSCKLGLLGTRDDLFRYATPPRVPQYMNEVLDIETGDLFEGEGSWDEEDEAYEGRFGIHTNDPTQWIWGPALFYGTLQAAHLRSIHFTNGLDPHKNENTGSHEHSETACLPITKPSAVFDPDDSDWTLPKPVNHPSTRYVFTPATVLDTKMTRSEQEGYPFSWFVDQPSSSEGFDLDAQTGHLILRGLQTCRGYWKIPQEAEPQTFVLY